MVRKAPRGRDLRLPWRRRNPRDALFARFSGCSSRALLVAFLAAALSGCLAPERGEQAEAAAAVRARGLSLPAPGPRLDERLDEALAARPTIEAVAEAAARRNPDAVAALERWVAFLERVPQETSLPSPVLRYEYSSMDLSHAIGLEQEIPFPAKLVAGGRAALAAARAARADFEERERVLRTEAAKAFAALYLARREHEIVERNLGLLDRFVSLAETRYATGAATQPDILRAQVERDELLAERAALAQEIEAAASGLNVLLDRPPEAPLGPLGPLPEPATPVAAPELFARALEKRPELEAAFWRAVAAAEAESRARQDWIPDLALGGAYVRDFRMHENEVEVMAGLSLPLWWGRISAGVAAAEAEERRARAELRAARNRVADEVVSARARARAAAERYAVLAGGALLRARQNVQASEAAYVSGRIDFLSVIDAQRMLLVIEREVERARADFAARRADLERAVGGF
jgi:outer membrane protein TolC